MKEKQTRCTLIFAAIAMVVLILDTKTALQGAADGINICLRTVIPSLLPFLFLSCLLSSALPSVNTVLLRPVGKLCGIPSGSEGILLLGLLGGYPVGAQAVTDAYKRKELSAPSARRMLGFCSNAGPAFIFGMLGTVFTSKAAPWLLWLIHIVSAIVVGAVLPRCEVTSHTSGASGALTAPQALERSARSMANICGWVIIFRVLLSIFDRWAFWALPPNVRLAIVGVMELSNGCCELSGVSQEGVRFVFASVFLALGGACVGMQTASVCRELGCGMYFPGKALQGLLSLLLATVMQALLFDRENRLVLSPAMYLVMLLGACIYIAVLRAPKKVVAFRRQMLYNSCK